MFCTLHRQIWNIAEQCSPLTAQKNYWNRTDCRNVLQVSKPKLSSPPCSSVRGHVNGSRMKGPSISSGSRKYVTAREVGHAWLTDLAETSPTLARTFAKSAFCGVRNKQCWIIIQQTLTLRHSKPTENGSHSSRLLLRTRQQAAQVETSTPCRWG